MEDQGKKILVGVIVLVIVLLGAGAVYWYYQRPKEVPVPLEEPKTEKPSEPSPSPEPKREGEKEFLPKPSVALPDLNRSDDFVRQMLRNLSPHGKLPDRLTIKEYI